MARGLEFVLGYVYPNVCQVCERHHASLPEGYVCALCRAKVRAIIPPLCQRCGLPFDGDLNREFECTNCRELPLHFDSARSAVLAQGLVLEVIHRYKYQQATWFEPFLSNLLVNQAQANLSSDRWDVIVPVPLHRVRERERGFNQATRLARRLGQALSIPVNNNLLLRTRATRSQTLLSRRERLKNMKTAFAINPALSISGQRVVLVDDVFTTGATTSACARVLRARGATAVCVWTVARGN